MKAIAHLALAAVLWAAPGHAQDQILVYFAGIEQHDLYNSSGTRLTDPCAILRQDRANVHRFGRPGPYDTQSQETFFANSGNRAAFGGDCAAFDGYATARLKRGEAYVRVVVSRMPGGALRIRFGEGAG